MSETPDFGTLFEADDLASQVAMLPAVDTVLTDVQAARWPACWRSTEACGGGGVPMARNESTKRTVRERDGQVSGTARVAPNAA